MFRKKMPSEATCLFQNFRIFYFRFRLRWLRTRSGRRSLAHVHSRLGKRVPQGEAGWTAAFTEEPFQHQSRTGWLILSGAERMRHSGLVQSRFVFLVRARPPCFGLAAHRFPECSEETNSGTAKTQVRDCFGKQMSSKAFAVSVCLYCHFRVLQYCLQRALQCLDAVNKQSFVSSLR